MREQLIFMDHRVHTKNSCVWFSCCCALLCLVAGRLYLHSSWLFFDCYNWDRRNHAIVAVPMKQSPRNLVKIHIKPIRSDDMIIVKQSTHYNDFIMSPMASQITSPAIVYSTVYSSANQRKHQSPASLAFVRGIHLWPVNSPHKGPVTRKIFPFDVVIMQHAMYISYRTYYTWNLYFKKMLFLFFLEPDFSGDKTVNMITFLFPYSSVILNVSAFWYQR